jgi:DNA polymerase-3 subunit epsilon
MKSAGFPLLTAAVCLLLAGVVALSAAVVWLDLPGDAKPVLWELLLPRIGLVLLVLLISCIAVGMLLQRIWRNFVVAPLQLADQLQLMLEANPQQRLGEPAARPLRPLAAAANRLAEQRDALQRDVAAQIRNARTSLEEERNRLAALMSELSQSVVVCNLDGRILLYNSRAEALFRAFEPDGGSSGSLIGLGRSIFSIFDRNLIGHAVENLQRQLDGQGHQPASHFVTTTPTGHLLRAQMAPVYSAGSDDGISAVAVQSIGGYVLMLEDITRAVENETRRDEILQSLTEGSRPALANIRAAVESLLDYPDIEAVQRERFLHIIDDEVRGMGARLDKVVADHADSLKARWPLEEMRGADLIAAAQRRIESRFGLVVKLDTLDAKLWLKVDSFSLIQVIVYLAGRLQEVFAIHLLHLLLSREGRLARLDLAWTGAPVSGETIHAWENEPMSLSGETTPLTLHDIMDRHGGEFWFQRESATQQACFRLLLPVAERQEPFDALPRTGSRPEYYDFDLFKRAELNHSLDDRLLTELIYTVFDTETTGLDPSAGDEIIQLGAVRIVNGRLLRHECFDRLVDPRRPLNAASVAIHGITEEMLAGQPDIGRVLPGFQRFAEDTVLVAHNAAFDMRFLQLKEEATGIRFTQPVLDTLLLSALLQPNQESHQLEAIAARFGIAVIGRHTALGDAIVTGEVFLRMIPLLNAIGIRTLGEALAAARQTYYARIRY